MFFFVGGLFPIEKKILEKKITSFLYLVVVFSFSALSIWLESQSLT